jgi:nucleoid-associated protein YgaU
LLLEPLLLADHHVRCRLQEHIKGAFRQRIECVMGSRLVAWLIALLVVVALAGAGIYLYRQPHGGPPPHVATGEGAKPVPPGKSEPGEAGPAKHTAVPTFDVVRIEPTGEGVIAGQAEPGWTVKVESAGTVYGEASADEEGAWSIVLDKPLPPGNHSLALRAYSPDGTRALTAQQPVRVAVGKVEGAAPSEQAAEASDLASQPQPVVPDENAPRERGTPPVKINAVEYQDKGEDSGTISLSGIGQPNVQVYLFYDNKPLGEFSVGEDGTWTYEVEKRLDNAEHTIRADTYDEKTRVVQGRASVRLAREQQAPAPVTAEQKAAPEAAPAAPSMAEAGGTTGQPVYPEGAPEAAAASPPPTAPAPEPYDLSSQPQPVHPEETAAAEAAPVASQDLSSQPQPVYPEETTVAEAAPAAPQDLSAQPQPVYPQEAVAPEAEAAASTPEAAAPTGSRAQPEPVYPEGAPEIAASSVAAPQQAAPEPYDLSSQPQAVVPEETAAEESARKMAAETPAEPPQPEAVPAEPGAPPVAAERPAEEPPAAPKQPPVVFKSVDYQDKDDSGTVSITGSGEPGARIFLFFDNQPLGEVTVGDDGAWAFEGEKRVEKGEHNFRADRLDETGVVIGRASIGIVRLEAPKAPAQAVAAAPQPAPSVAPSEKASGEETATTGEPPATGGGSQEAGEHPKSYVVQRGDTLWDIAEEYYGGGWRYRAIVRENRRQIHNPHWIYPDQQFRLP